ncbi:SDR family NAD(P)-dependent oxidoreductase [Rhodococcus erythropolis]|uniref:SDR family NAD(P)-dependent oxidoreductase n=1 Tax=Rhodococcus erythropolis TaxID=1833 RepID=UPI002948EB86|nr:SDR family NAD(P)-dependent oxidoreductase [Rhodococcus erythropolis]MDV6212766.1 SDR family NAD(P)-dependent oxidoreductase [Rhodococcus erythropolis]
MRELQGKAAVVTGAASGIGLALGHALAAEGAHVVLTDVDQKAVSTVAGEFESYGVSVEARAVDVSDATAVEGLAEWAWSRFGRIDVLCNNAGVDGFRGGALWEADAEDWSWTFGVNVWGVVNGVTSFLPRMLADGVPSHIVNTASASAIIKPSNMYGITKHTVLAYTEALHAQLDAQRSSVGVTVLIPGPVATPFFSRARPQDAGDQGQGTLIRASNNELLQQEGISPDAVARRTISAIRENELYALTHESTKEYPRRRTGQLVASTTVV